MGVVPPADATEMSWRHRPGVLANEATSPRSHKALGGAESGPSSDPAPAATYARRATGAGTFRPSSAAAVQQTTAATTRVAFLKVVLRSVTVLVAMTVVAGACSSTGPKAQSATVAAGNGPQQVGAAWIERPAGTGPLDVSAKSASSKGTAPDGVEPVGNAVALDSNADHDTGPIRVGLAVPDGVDPQDAAMASLVDGTWVPEASTYDPARNVMFAETDHLSNWILTRISGFGAAVSKIKTAITDVVGLGTIGASPDCGPAPLGPGAVTVSGAVDPADSLGLEGCAHLDGDQLIARLADRHATGVQLELPVGVNADTESIPGAGDAAAQAIAVLNRALGEHIYLIPAGGWLDLNVPSDQPSSIPAMTDTTGATLSVIFVLAGDAEGGWAALSTAASSETFLADIANHDLTSALRGGIAEFLKALAATASSGVLKAVAGVASAVVGTAVIAVRGVIEGLDFSHSAATVRINPPATCTPASTGAALSAAVGHTVTVSAVNCAGDWAAATVSAPPVDSQDGPALLVMVDGQWVPKGSSMGDCPAQLDMPIDVFTQLIGDPMQLGCVAAPTTTTTAAPPPSGGCADPQAVANNLGAQFSAHWPGVVSWADQPDFESFARPRIEAMAASCGKAGAESVLEDMNVVGHTWQAFTAWAGV
jgi:hypothetical protein